VLLQIMEGEPFSVVHITHFLMAAVTSVAAPGQSQWRDLLTTGRNVNKSTGCKYGGDLKLLICISLFYLSARFRGPVDFLREREAIVDINSVRLLGRQTPR